MSATPRQRRRFLWRASFAVLALAIGLFLLAVLLFDRLGFLTPKLPEPKPFAGPVRLPQNWGSGWGWGGREWFHHVNQGTTIMPYRWLIALDQPEIRVLRRIGRFIDRDFMSRFGFLPGAADPEFNPEGLLPIGWAIQRGFRDPTADPKAPDAYNARPYDAVGLTCAACHTGRLSYTRADGKRLDLVVEGGSANINLRELQTALGTAVAYTLYVPGRFGRFADRVLGDGHSRGDRDRLRAQLQGWFEEAKKTKEHDDQLHVNQLESGFGRTDALSLIGNRVFGPIDPGNVVAAGAPVNFPHLWDASWFDWVQYNGSIRMVMVRNIGEALGVGARTNVTPGDSRLLQSSVNVANLHAIEAQLGGPAPFKGLTAPSWEDAVRLAGFPPLKPELVARGKGLYDTYCRKCHGPSVKELSAALDAKDTRYWRKPEGKAPFDRWFLKTPMYRLDQIGTDPAQAVDFAFRFASVPDPAPGDTTQALADLGSAQGGADTPVPVTSTNGRTITVSAAKGLRVITEVIRERAYQAAGLTPEQVAEWDRWRDNRPGLPDAAVIVANLMYKARPLDGIWATPPYLHNASVPNLEALLSPVAMRPATFRIGPTEYDTERVGYRIDGDRQGFLLDTRLSGNHNSGHEFRDLTLLELEGDLGILDLGAGLTVDARWSRLLNEEAQRSKDLTEDERQRLKGASEDYPKLREEERRRLRKDLTAKALERALKEGETKFFGVIGPGLEPDDRRALIEYVKSL